MAIAFSAGDPLALARILPIVAITAMAAEYLWGRLLGRSLYDPGETAATIVLSIGNRLTTTLLSGLSLLPMVWVYQHRLVDWTPAESPLAKAALWGVVFLTVDFLYYWHHRAMHGIRWLWTTHLVHHSATRFNLSAAIRLGWGSQVLGGALFYLPLAWAGVPPRMIAVCLGVNLAYQFLLHLADAPRFGPLEWLLNTPTHHRVHHASNDSCLDRNFGGVLIVFDRLFGTFAEQPGNEELRFGLKDHPVSSRNPLALLTAGWRDIAARLWHSETWADRYRAILGRP